MEIYNGTQHEIIVYSIEDTYPVQGGRKLILREGAEPLVIIPKGVNLNCQKGNLDAPNFECKVPLKGAVLFNSVDDLPDDASGKLVVVSNLYRAAAKELGRDTSLLATVDGVVYDSEEAIRPCGCLGLAVG